MEVQNYITTNHLYQLQCILQAQTYFISTNTNIVYFFVSIKKK